MTYYFIEFRFHGKAKKEIKELILGLNKRSKIFSNKRPIPHITLISPFYTNQERRLINDFKGICEKHPLIKFEIKGYGTFERSRVVYINIVPSSQMIEFRNDLIKRLKPHCKLNSTDIFSLMGIIKINKKYSPHVTLAMKINPIKFKQIKGYIQNLKECHYNHNLIRATLIKDNRILYEYDFIQRRLLNRKQAKSKEEFRKTIGLFKGGNFKREP